MFVFLRTDTTQRTLREPASDAVNKHCGQVEKNKNAALRVWETKGKPTEQKSQMMLRRPESSVDKSMSQISA